jgi:hypothetical protein
MDEDELFNYLKTYLSLDVDQEENYTGDMDGSGNLYETETRVILRLNGEEISSVTI